MELTYLVLCLGLGPDNLNGPVLDELKLEIVPISLHRHRDQRSVCCGIIIHQQEKIYQLSNTHIIFVYIQTIMSSSNNNNNAGRGAGNPKQLGLRGFGFFTPATVHQPTTEEQKVQQDTKSNGGKENPTLCGGKKVTPVPVESGGTKHPKRKHQSTTTKNDDDGASKKMTLSIPSLPSPPNNKVSVICYLIICIYYDTYMCTHIHDI